ncbi:MAG TPA: aminoacyl-tRNA hydrolase [Candidatus Eisenbacteria bacterium]|uniref:Aminoacyl-tRNA hydrolase n=1 Tax=Eiseniibacteriota bacterium TaxID=2212470 RepID=A0A7V2AV87_UNCEI|nr:aminoacyl-tRNA hydrolase [Candidatus Eisenbacteria bacterium]
MVEIHDQLTIPDEEISFEFSRSGGPGGQNVNKVNTKATLLFDVSASPSLTEEERSRIMSSLRTRITKAGVLRVSSQRHRTQRANREAALERFSELLREALRTRRPRRKTRVPRAVKERRIKEKKRRGELKRRRGAADDW